MDISGIDMIQLTLILCFMSYTLTVLCRQHVRGLLALCCSINSFIHSYAWKLKCTKFYSRRLSVRPSLRWSLTLGLNLRVLSQAEKWAMRLHREGLTGRLHDAG